MDQDTNAIKKTAQLAGILYLLGGLTAPFALIYVPGKLLVPGDATATANALRTLGGLLRMGIAVELLGFTLSIFVSLVLYRLFKAVSQQQALALLVLSLLSIPIVFVNLLNEIAALQLAAGGANFLSVFDAPQRDALAYLFLSLHGKGFTVAQIFWGLWLFPFGILVIRSGFIPRVLGVLLIIAGVGNLIAAFTALVLPQYVDRVSLFTTVLSFGEMPIIFWLLIRGARPQPAAARSSRPQLPRYNRTPAEPALSGQEVSASRRRS